MIKFMRGKDGSLYSVKDGKVTGRISSFGDTKKKKQSEVRSDGRNR